MRRLIRKRIFLAALIGIGLILFFVVSFFPMSMEESPAGYYTYTFGWFFGSWLTLYGFSGNETLFSLLAHNDGFSINLFQLSYTLLMSGISSLVLCFLPRWLTTFFNYFKKRKANPI